MKIRRTYTREFKLQIVCECENSEAMAQLSRQHGIHPSLITIFRLLNNILYFYPPHEHSQSISQLDLEHILVISAVTDPGIDMFYPNFKYAL